MESGQFSMDFSSPESGLDSGRKKKIIVFAVVVLLLVVAASWAYSTYSGAADSVNLAQKSPSKVTQKDVLVSFVINDVTFKKSQRFMLEDAASLAHKYNITFDLAVIAKQFDSVKDNETYQVYLDNKDVFEIVAHGWDQSNPINKNTLKGEFATIGSSVQSIPLATQQSLFNNMTSIFKKYDLPLAQKIFVVPGYAGDNTTLTLAQKEGYKMVVMNYPAKTLEYKSDSLIVTKAFPSSALNEWDGKNSVSGYPKELIGLISGGQKFVELPLYPWNFDYIASLDKSIGDIVAASKNYTQNTKQKIVFGFMSKELNREFGKE